MLAEFELEEGLINLGDWWNNSFKHRQGVLHTQFPPT